MKFSKMSFLLALTVLFLVSNSLYAAKGSISPRHLKKLRSNLQMDVHSRAVQNALTSTSIKTIAQNRQIIVDHTDKFSHKIKTKGISSQNSSGRCWMFAGFNTIKPIVMKNADIDSFEFSHVYLQFWDKLEKANTFLERIIEFRHQDLLDREMVFLLKYPCPDGGYWENFANLVEKYGVIPKEAMAESASSDNTGAMNKTLSRILRKNAVQLREILQKTKSVKKMQAAKGRMLADVYRILVLNLGEPPAEFQWRHTTKKKDEDETDDEDGNEGQDDEDGEDKDGDDDDEDKDKDKDDYDVKQKLSELVTYTPQSFYKEFIDLDLSEFVNIANDPIRPEGHYAILLTQNLYNGDRAHYANVQIDTFRQVVLDMLLDNRAVYFAADVSPDQDTKKGIMARGLYDYESIYDLDLGLNKRERLLYRDSTVNHGMAFIGVDIQDDKPVKWLVENSWGSSRGKNGLWTMYDNWFGDNVFNVIIHKDYLPDEVLETLKKPAKKLPVWDPMW